MKKVRWLMDGEVPVETNVTAYKITCCLTLPVLVGVVAVLVTRSHSIGKSVVVIVAFLPLVPLFHMAIWQTFTKYSEEYSDELHRRSD